MKGAIMKNKKFFPFLIFIYHITIEKLKAEEKVVKNRKVEKKGVFIKCQK